MKMNSSNGNKINKSSADVKLASNIKRSGLIRDGSEIILNLLLAKKYKTS